MPDIFVQHRIQLPPAHQVHKSQPLRTLTSYGKYPLNITFRGQETDESVVLFLRAGFLTNIPWLIGVVLLSVIPFLLNFISKTIQGSTLTFPYHTFFILLLFYYLIVLGDILVNLLIWFYTMYLVTNKRVLSFGLSHISGIDQNQILFSDITEITHTKNQFFNFGNVYLHSQTGTLILEHIPKASEVNEFIHTRIKEYTYA